MLLSDIKQMRIGERHAAELSGVSSDNLKAIESVFEVSITLSGDEIYIIGEKEAVDMAYQFIKGLLEGDHMDYSPEDMIRVANDFVHGKVKGADLAPDAIVKTYRGKVIKPKTAGQRRIVKAIQENDVVFVIGPAGTGKTYISVAMAVAYFKAHKVSRIVLTRPVIEAGEKLGFLPGDILQKVDPYFRPLYDALYDMMGFDRVNKYIQKNIIEIAPLAYMRGRTFNDSFIIMDEAQNTTIEQMKMALTRLGWGSKLVITGDIMQIDLEHPGRSGLLHALEVLKDVRGIAMVFLDETDNVRHDLVQKIIRAYKVYEKETDYDRLRGRLSGGEE
ncbi:AAA family ATPase [bacterium 3DAC]|nr:PhoH family protein [Dictyoglomota bacterium]UZN23567.1 AAA family ATPase [bacterium 3DAC]